MRSINFPNTDNDNDIDDDNLMLLTQLIYSPTDTASQFLNDSLTLSLRKKQSQWCPCLGDFLVAHP